MSIRRLQGFALIVSGVLGLLGILRSDSPVIRILFIVGALLLLLGVPSIETTQPMGPLGVAGIVLVMLGALVALIFSLSGGGAAQLGSALPLAGALAGALGRLLVGWLTSRQGVFPAWAAWAFIIEGLLNVLGGVLEIPALGPALSVIIPIAGALALLGYGLGVIRHAAMAQPSAEPSAR